MTNSGSFACLQIHLDENVLHHSSKCYSQGLCLRRLGQEFPDKSVLEPHNRECSEPERSGSCTGGMEIVVKNSLHGPGSYSKGGCVSHGRSAWTSLKRHSNPLNVLRSSHSF